MSRSKPARRATRRAAAFTLLLLVLSASFYDVVVVAQELPGQAPLKFNGNADQTFKIVVFTDMHFGESSDKDQKSLALQRAVLDAEKPDFIVFNGDIVSGWLGRKRGWMESKMREILAYPNSQGYRHALLLGNHDDEANLNRVQILEEDKKISRDLSYSQIGPDDITGASNYYLDVYSGVAGQQDRVDARLWFFDSMNRECEGRESWGCVGRDTVAWYADLSESLVPVDQQVAFVHIPIPEHMLGYGDFRMVGFRQEDSSCPIINTGLAKELALHGVNMVVSGHDHGNTYAGNINLQARYGGLGANETGYFAPGSGIFELEDIPMLMAYGRKSGFGSYGPSGPLGKVDEGARVIELRTFDSPDIERQQTIEFVNTMNAYSFAQLPPQMLHGGPFKWMQTYVTDLNGERELSDRPNFKYIVQEACYSAAVGKAAWILMAGVVGVFAMMGWS